MVAELPRSEQGVGSQAFQLLHSRTEALTKYRYLPSTAVWGSHAPESLFGTEAKFKAIGNAFQCCDETAWQ